MNCRKLITGLAIAALFLSACGKDDDPKVDYTKDKNKTEKPNDQKQDPVEDSKDDPKDEDDDPYVFKPQVVPVGTPLKVQGNQLVGPDGQVVNLHGFCQTYSNYFNQAGTPWGQEYTIAACSSLCKQRIDAILEKGWQMDFVRLHMDPEFCHGDGYSGEATMHLSFDEKKFKNALEYLYIPMAEYMQSKGLRVVMRPPGVAPHEIALGDAYQKYLIKVWTICASHSKLKNNPNIMFELAYEPVNFKPSNGGAAGSHGGAIDRELSQFFQEIVDKIRATGCNNILWVPGTSWQQNYDAYAQYPITGENIGYAVHCYPGWYGSDCYQETGEVKPDMWRGSKGGYDGFKEGWDKAIMNTVGKTNPILITEMDWSDNKFWHDAPTASNPKNRVGPTWGCSTTGEAGGAGFGANFRKIMDECGNVSFVTFVWDYDLAEFNPLAKPNPDVMIYDPESGVLPVYKWFSDYRKESYKSANAQ